MRTITEYYPLLVLGTLLFSLCIGILTSSIWICIIEIRKNLRRSTEMEDRRLAEILNLHKDVREIICDLSSTCKSIETRINYDSNLKSDRDQKFQEKLDGLFSRLDQLENEVVTQQITRHRLNEFIRSRIEEKSIE